MYFTAFMGATLIDFLCHLFYDNDPLLHVYDIDNIFVLYFINKY